jgi:hypothetical protein
MKSALRIIIIEDNPDDALLVTREVEHAGCVVQVQHRHISGHWSVEETLRCANQVSRSLEARSLS